MLQNNHLYRRIQHKNIFRTFSKAYTKQNYKQQALNNIKLYAKHPHNIENRSQSANNCREIQQLQHKKSAIVMNSSRKQNQYYYRTININDNSVQKTDNGIINSNTIQLPFQNIKSRLSKNYKSDINNTISSHDDLTESRLPTWKKRKRQSIFKLKSCQVQNFDTYQSEFDKTQFSTIDCQMQNQLQKRSAFRYHLKNRNKKQNKPSFKNEITAYNFGTGSRGSFLLSKYCRFLNTAPNTRKDLADKRQKIQDQK